MADLRSSTMIRDLDACCLKGNCLSYNTFLKVQIQGLTVKKFKSEEFKSKKPKISEGKSSALPYTNEPIKFNCKNKRWKWLKKKKSSISAIRNNAIKSKKKRILGNINQVNCYNCQKKATLQINATSQKTSISLGNFCLNN